MIVNRSFALVCTAVLSIVSIERVNSFVVYASGIKSGRGLSNKDSCSVQKMTTDTTTESTKIESPYGSWESAITSKAITAGSVGIGSLTMKGDDLYWIEGRPQEGGRYVLCKYDESNEKKSERNAVDVSPKESNVRTRVHEYGGTSFVFSEKNDVVYYSEFMTQQLQKLSLTDSEKVEPLIKDGAEKFRFADGICYNEEGSDNDKLILIREDHTNPAPKDVVNEIVSIDVASGEITVLATGNDFYSSPRLSPDGKQLAYVTWDHPNMPWDATELRVVDITESKSSKSADHTLIAGTDGDTSVMQPLWHPKTGDLYYISDESGYYNIYRSYESDGNRTSQNILSMESDFGGSAPGWRLGQQGYQFLTDSSDSTKLVATYGKDGQSKLIVADLPSDAIATTATNVEEYGMDHGLPMQFGGVIVGNGADGKLYFMGGSPSSSSSVFEWSLKEKKEATVLASSSSVKFSDDVISVPKLLEFPTTDDKTAFGFYYPPKNEAYKCTEEDKKTGPPLLVKVHGGPTACTGTMFNPGIQYWTSRGFAILDVDYGGSTGYGREYRRRLRNSWGIVDIDDVCNGASYCVEQGLADKSKLCIDGGSAGGYTTLAALAFKDVFKAGCSLFGVADLKALAGDTHKFESRYLDGLIGKYPEDEHIYKERAPIEHTDKLSCPILLLQGDEDKIVPPNQATMMYDALKEKGIPTCLKIYKGEQHGFRKAENIEDSLDSELAFYGKVFNIDVPNAVDIKIDNL